MSGSGAGMSTRTTATTAITVVAAIAAAASTARWTTGTATALAARVAALVSALFVPLITRQTSVAYSSTAHEGGKPKWAVLLLCGERNFLY